MMKVIWIIPLLVLMIFSGCTESKNNTLPPKSEGINNSAIQSSRTPNLTDGSEGKHVIPIH
ncbi:hypothetical protein ACLMAB_10775 [Brevibacillus laterosporus]